MSVSNGQVANASTFNTAFVSRTVDTSLIGQIDLDNADSASGSSIINTQRELNATAHWLGRSTGAAKTDLPAWASDEIGTPGEALLSRLNAIVVAFSGTIGHTHDGTDGNGPPIDFPATTSVYGMVKLGSTAATNITGSSSSAGAADGETANASHTHRGVASVAKSGSSALYGAVTFSEGSNITLTQSGNDISIASSGGGGGGTGGSVCNRDTYSGDNSTTAFTLTVTPSTEDNVFVFISGVYQDKSTYSVSGTTLTFSTAPATGSGNVEVITGIGSLVSQASPGFVASAGQLLGTNTNDDAAGGYVGQLISNNPGAPVASGSTGAYKTITSVSLTAGDWDVSGFVGFSTGSLSGGSAIGCSVSKTTNAQDVTNKGGFAALGGTIAGSALYQLSTGVRRISVGTTTTVYLVGMFTGTVGSAEFSVDSFISARRVR